MPISAEGSLLSATLGIWAPQIIKRFGLSNLEVGSFNVIPPTVAVIAMLVLALGSPERGDMARRHCPPRSGSRLALAGISNTAVAVISSLVLVNAGISAAKPPQWVCPYSSCPVLRPPLALRPSTRSAISVVSLDQP